MPPRSLIVINPNSSATVTAGIDSAIAPLRAFGVPIRCETLAEGPPGIETQAHIDGVAAPLKAMVRRLEPEALGFVVACFSDPAVPALARATTRPVLGIRAAALSAALTLGARIGIIAILPASAARHTAAIAEMGLAARCAGIRALDLGVADLADPERTTARLLKVARALRDSDGADVLILGCAGMARYRSLLESTTGLPVVDPSQAATVQMLGRIALTDPQQEPSHAR